jgi:hypothetical protein
LFAENLGEFHSQANWEFHPFVFYEAEKSLMFLKTGITLLEFFSLEVFFKFNFRAGIFSCHRETPNFENDELQISFERSSANETIFSR